MNFLDFIENYSILQIFNSISDLKWRLSFTGENISITWKSIGDTWTDFHIFSFATLGKKFAFKANIYSGSKWLNAESFYVVMGMHHTYKHKNFKLRIV